MGNRTKTVKLNQNNYSKFWKGSGSSELYPLMTRTVTHNLMSAHAIRSPLRRRALTNKTDQSTTRAPRSQRISFALPIDYMASAD